MMMILTPSIQLTNHLDRNREKNDSKNNFYHYSAQALPITFEVASSLGDGQSST